MTDHSNHYLLKLWIKHNSPNRLFQFFVLSCARSELMQGGVGKTLTIWFQNSNKHKKCKGSNIGTVVCCNASLEPEIRKESFPLNWTLSAKTSMLVADCVSLEFSINSPHRWWKYIHTHESRTRAIEDFRWPSCERSIPSRDITLCYPVTWRFWQCSCWFTRGLLI